MPGKGERRGREGGRNRGGDEEGKKVRTPPPSIPAYAPVSRSSDVIHD